ncbi:nucleotide-diphospho-sugar transferase [Lophium mytilinum]|uniref:Nucleotide-diphospho-sugar transferase n=1 Tax=Lophium mytilinum TaxID=390894 RepID=A0A6A6QZS6_9PEZI|nr:nucleotide-diphospho-sugar transferase [Lophium mytilinum]
MHLPGGRKFAFATFLAPRHPGEPERELEDTDTDSYFESARVMAYRLLHSPSARSSAKIDFIALVTSEVTQAKKDRLARDGATVVVVDRLVSEWITPKEGRWQDVLSKLRLWTMTQYDKIAFIDADHLITQPLDGVFDDPAVAIQYTAVNASVMDAAPLPDTYVFAARPEVGNYGHDNPPNEGDYLNSGFFVLKPDMQMFEYFEELMLPKHEGLFRTVFPEQDMLNYVFRREGKMPWGSLWQGWNRNFPNEDDFRYGVHSYHDKFWDAGSDHVLSTIWHSQRKEMEDYWANNEKKA